MSSLRPGHVCVVMWCPFLRWERHLKHHAGQGTGRPRHSRRPYLKMGGSKKKEEFVSLSEATISVKADQRTQQAGCLGLPW